MLKTLLGAAVAGLLAIGLQVPASADGIPRPTLPSTPGQPSTIAGCWKWTLSNRVESRSYSLSGHRFVEFRTVAQVLRWCPSTGYVVVTWRGPWHPGQR